MRFAVVILLSAHAVFAQAPAVQEIVLTDLAAPQVVPVTTAATIHLKHPGPARAVTLFALRTVLSAGANRGVILELEEGFDAPIKVAAPEKNGTAQLIITAENTVDSPPLIVSPPPSMGVMPGHRELLARDLSAHTLIFFPNAREAKHDLAGLWATVPEAWLAYTTTGMCSGNSGPVGEPVLVTMAFSDRLSLQRLNGDTLDCRGPDFAATINKPSMLRFSPPRARFTVTEYLFDDEHFLAQQGSDPAIAKYAAKKDTTRACADALRKKLDPDERAGHYDLVTRDAKGNEVKVEAFAEVIARKIDARCKLTALNADRDAIYARLYAANIAEQRREMEALAKRLGVPIDPQPEKSPMYRLR